jgi:precorrin-6A/cobalt-precorrin-6A reductase
MTDTPTILLLAGTFEARGLARRLKEALPNARITASFAGAVSSLPDLGVETRTGGFGGIDGLAGYLKDNSVDLVIDATHPFAAQMSAHAVRAGKTAGVPVVRLERPPWREEDGDHWTRFASLPAAADAIPSGARVFLAIGRKDIGRFTHRTDVFALARMIEPPELPLPPHWHLRLDRPSTSVGEEKSLLEQHGISHIVAKNSGGTRAKAKLVAARRLGLPVLMVERPELPPTPFGATIDEVLRFSIQALD